MARVMVVLGIGVVSKQHKNTSKRRGAAGAGTLLLGMALTAAMLAGQSVQFAGSQSTVGSGLNYPYGVAVDAAGDVFIGDYGNQRVVKVTPDGTQTTVVSGAFMAPWGVAVDGAGDVFISETDFNRVVKVTPDGTQTTVGSGLNQPYGVALDGAGDVFIADTGNNRVVKVQTVSANFGNANLCPAGQTSPAPCSQTLTLNYDISNGGTLGTPRVLTDGAPNLDYTAASGSTCSGAAGSSCSVNVTFTPRFAGLRRGAVQVTNGSGAVLATTLLQGIGVGPQIAFGPGTQTTVGSGLYRPFGVAVDGAGDVFIADTPNNRVVKVTPDGTQTTVGSGLSYPEGLAVDGAGDVFIADIDNTRVVKVTPDGTQTTVGSGLSVPNGVAVDGAGVVFIADAFNNRVVKVTPDGSQTTVGSGLFNPSGVAVDGAGDVFIADNYNNRVVKVQRSQPPTLTLAATVLGNTSSDSPQSISVENSGNAPLSALAPGLSLNSPNFAQVPGSGTPADCSASFALAPGDSCNLSVSFTPTTIGPITGSVVLTDNARNGNPARQSIGLTGSGLQKSQTITFSAIPNQVFGTALRLTASASSGLTVSFTSQTSSVCTVSGTTATLVSAGTCSIQASQIGNNLYAAATPVTQSFSVTDFSITMTPASQTISSGHSATYSVALKSLNGFSGTVALSCSGGPPHSTCTVSPSSLGLSTSASAKVSVTLQTPQNGNHGTFSLTITAKAGADIHTAPVSLTVK